MGFFLRSGRDSNADETGGLSASRQLLDKEQFVGARDPIPILQHKLQSPLLRKILQLHLKLISFRFGSLLRAPEQAPIFDRACKLLSADSVPEDSVIQVFGGAFVENLFRR